MGGRCDSNGSRSAVYFVVSCFACAIIKEEQARPRLFPPHSFFITQCALRCNYTKHPQSTACD